MPRERFKCLLRFLRFDDCSTRLERIQTDKPAPIRWLFDNIQLLFLKYYKLGKFLTIDERSARYRGRCGFRDSCSRNQEKHGIKIWIIADSLTYYPIKLEVYVGKQSASNKTEDLVMRLSQNLRPSHVLISDNYFTSLKLLERLLSEHKILYFGTLQHNRKEVPKTMKTLKGIPKFTSQFISYKGSKMLSYVRNYNAYKSGVDSLDQKISALRPYRTTRRWPCVIFFDLVAYILQASWVIYCLKYPD